MDMPGGRRRAAEPGQSLPTWQIVLRPMDDSSNAITREVKDRQESHWMAAQASIGRRGGEVSFTLRTVPKCYGGRVPGVPLEQG